eukprot:2591645-Pyramimonas_sp.AAC.1
MSFGFRRPRLPDVRGRRKRSQRPPVDGLRGPQECPDQSNTLSRRRKRLRRQPPKASGILRKTSERRQGLTFR